MGIYLMPAGTSSKNRFRSLDKSFTSEELKPYLPEEEFIKLKSYFSHNTPIYIWGARKGSISQLECVQEGEYVLDFKNQDVVNVFEFCFRYEPMNDKIQNYIDWQGNFKEVFFLMNPKQPGKSKKSYYGEALGYTSGPRWLMGQRYIDDKQLNEALNRTNSNSVEEFLGIKASKKRKDKQSISEEVITAENQKPKTKKSNASNNDNASKSKTENKTRSSQQNLKVSHVVVKENETGISYDDLFGKYLEGATDITVVDPYIRLPYQVRNFLEFAQVIADIKDQDQILLHLVTNNQQKFLPNSNDAFEEIKDTLAPLGIFFTHEFDEDIHDRHIKTDTGWKIILGRGLDIFQKPKGRYSLATLDQKQRKCKRCEITYLKVNTN